MCVEADGGAGGMMGDDMNARCRSNDDCPDGQRCNRVTRMCVEADGGAGGMMGEPEPAGCGPDMPCAEGQVCTDRGLCRPDCRVEGNECPRGVCNEETGLCGRAVEPQ